MFYLTDSSPLSLDPNTASRNLILSEEDRRVTRTDQPQPYSDHPQRFTCSFNVLSREPLPGCSYSEVESSGENVGIAVCYKDINRKEEVLSDFGRTDQSWMLRCGSAGGVKSYLFFHNNIHTSVSALPSSTGRFRVGVFVDQPEGVLSFYSVDVEGNKLSLLHTERATFTKDLYVGIGVSKATAQVCKIW